MVMRRGGGDASERPEPLLRGELTDLDAQLGERLALVRELTSRAVQSRFASVLRQFATAPPSRACAIR